MASPRVAFLGLGIMGAPMAANLARAGVEVVAWNRTLAKAEGLAAEHENVSVADSPAAAATAADPAISMVPDVPEVEEVLLGPRGAAGELPHGGLAIDMSTISPTASRRIGERLGERGIAFLDAPVTGSRPKAEEGTLSIMAGGGAEAFERARPLFEAMGELVVHAGPQGHGSMVKLINNTLAAVNAAALAEGLALARAAGLDTDRALEVIRSGSGNSAMVALKAEPMLAGALDPLFKLEHMLKDVRHTIAEARGLGLEPRVAASAEGLYSQADERGLGGRDFAAVIEAVAWQARGAQPDR
ncbi:NAD(P)-dependent oxidoreductase [soil metagenome]